jgi:hypothetical protein
MLTNLIVLPAMLLSFNKSAVTEAFMEPEEKNNESDSQLE